MKFTSICLLAVTASTASAFAGVRQPTTQRALSTSLFAKPKIFIDGEAGTTGLQVRGRIEKRDDLEIISPPPELRKDDATRRKLINEADVVILCK
jgi:N-acetyl-gamma-glutamyl-phosphate reductase